ncbi:MAG: fibronectin type III domain-containing protein [Lachnospiraceae bacterium]|nr:fibronectin type III domain-containing protein [Lachnospiraceae bacterium]
MTNSGCTSGGVDGAENLRKDSYTAFAKYLTDVTRHLVDMGIPVESMEGMNEPDSNWAAGSPKQEGCVIWPGEAQSSVVTAMREQMTAQGLTDVCLTASDESATNQALNSYNSLSQAAKEAVDRIDTHTYTVSKPADLRVLAEQENKTLWMSEMDGITIGGTKAGSMRAALGLGLNISSQVNALLPAAWILWDAIDIHVDQDNPFDRDSLEEVGYDTLDQNGFWGLAVADHNEKQIYLTKKYYAYGQYSRYIRPGYTMLTVAGNNVAAYDTKTGTLVLVIDQTEAENQTYDIDLHRFGVVAEDASVEVIRTSGTLEDGENWADLSEQGTAVLYPDRKHMTAEVLGNSLTTYVIHGVSLPEEQENPIISVPGNLPEDSVVSEGFPELFDGSFASGYNRTKQYEEIVVDLGQLYDLREIAFAAYPRAEDSIEGGSILTSVDGNNWTELCKIDRLATGYYFNYIDPAMFSDNNASICRYVKFKDDDTYVALSEVKFYGQLAPEMPVNPAPSAPTVQGTEQKPQTTGTGAPAVQATKQPSAADQKVGQVKIKSVRSAKKKTVTIKWKKVNEAKGYRITYATNKTFRKGKKIINVKGTSRVIKKLKSGKKYYFKIEAYRGKTYGKASKVKSIKVK